MESPLHSKPSLPTERAFVLQFRRETDITQGPFDGRVEHVVSGQTTQFHSLEELLAFLTQVLQAQIQQSQTDKVDKRRSKRRKELCQAKP